MDDGFMSFDPRNFLELCKHLCKGVIFGDQETNTRNIIGRAYYSAFLHAKEYLKEKENVPFPNNSLDHQFVEEALKLKVSRSLGSYIHTLRENRNASDYDLNNPAFFVTDNGTIRSLNFDTIDQQENIILAENIILNLPRV